ncbi:hypothetical protein ACNOYE_14300 [Nannocystaceae bacterium ST9]
MIPPSFEFAWLIPTHFFRSCSSTVPIWATLVAEFSLANPVRRLYFFLMANPESSGHFSFSLNVDAVPLPDEAKQRITRNFHKNLLQELAQYENGIEPLVVFLDPRRGGKILRDIHGLGEMKLKDLFKDVR